MVASGDHCDGGASIKKTNWLSEVAVLVILILCGGDGFGACWVSVGVLSCCWWSSWWEEFAPRSLSIGPPKNPECLHPVPPVPRTFPRFR
jgi:hypothetical protein